MYSMNGTWCNEVFLSLLWLCVLESSESCIVWGYGYKYMSVVNIINYFAQNNLTPDDRGNGNGGYKAFLVYKVA